MDVDTVVWQESNLNQAERFCYYTDREFTYYIRSLRSTPNALAESPVMRLLRTTHSGRAMFRAGHREGRGVFQGNMRCNPRTKSCSGKGVQIPHDWASGDMKSLCKC
jgi:hypothetical protein